MWDVLEVVFAWNGFARLYKLTMFVCAGIICLMMLFKYRMLKPNMNETGTRTKVKKHLCCKFSDCPYL